MTHLNIFRGQDRLMLVRAWFQMIEFGSLMMDLQDYRLEMSGIQLPSEVTDCVARNLIILQDFFGDALLMFIPLTV